MGIDDFKYDDETNTDGVVADGQEKIDSSEAEDNLSESEVIQQGNDVILSEEIINFLADLKLNKNRQAISQILKSNKQLRDGLKDYILGNNSLENKSNIDNLQFRLMRCRTEDEIKSVIAENIPGGYKVGNEEIVEPIQTGGKTGGILLESINQADQKIEQNDNVLNIEQMTLKKEEDLELRRELLVGHDDVKAKTEKKAELAQQQLPEETRNQLKEKGYDDNFINDYILLRVTLNEVKGSPDFDENQVAQFESSVNELSTLDVILKNLDNACNIPDTSLSSFSTENVAQTRTELFNEDIGNESLRQVKKSNIESHKEVYSEMFPEEVGEKDLISNYGNFLQGELKQFFEKFVNNIGGVKNKIEEIKKNDNPTDEDKKLLQIYNYMIAELDKNRREAEEQTKKLMEEMCIISQIKGMSMCIGQEEGKDFNLNKANEIINDNGVLTLKGHIDGVDFSVSHDTINPNQRLKIKSKLGVDSEDQNTFEIGKEDNYVNSPFILPSQEEIFGVITKVVQSNDLSKSSDLPKYLEGLQNNIIGTMDEVYKDAELAHHYITNKVKGEKIVDNSLALIQGIKPNMQDLTKPINQGSNEKLFSFLKMIKFNVENSDTEEKNKLNQCMARIPEIIDAYKATGGTQNFAELKYPPIIENYLKNQAWLENGNEDSKLGLVFDMLSYYNQNSNDTRTNKESNDGVSSKIVINDLYRDLFEFSNNGQSEVGTKRKNENQEKQDKQEAEDVLALNDESIWPPVEYG